MKSRKEVRKEVIHLMLPVEAVKRFQNHPEYRSLDIALFCENLFLQRINSADFREGEKDSVIKTLSSQKHEMQLQTNKMQSQLQSANFQLKLKELELSSLKAKAGSLTKSTSPAPETPPAPPSKSTGDPVH